MNRQVLKLAVPSILANITIPFVGIVDLAIAGHLADAAAIGGIAIGTMLFDLLYWNFGFLRVGTGGMTAQAYGRRDFSGAMKLLTQSLSIALGAALAIWLIQWVFVEAAFALVDCSPEVEVFARKYFFVRVWAAPATLSLMVFKGWFIGMQNTVYPMAADIVVNVVNMAASYLLAVYTPLGVVGVAYGTLVAQYTGLLLSVVLLVVGYRKHFGLVNIRQSIRWKEVRQLFIFNGNIFIRSLCFMVVYVGFTSITAHYGDEQLAIGSIMMKIFMFFSYFIDGFSYAGEALTGRFIGEKDRGSVDRAVRVIFLWAMGIGLAFTVAYTFGGEWFVRLMTSDTAVIEGSAPFMGWLIAMPLISCAAFTWDGIYIGATAGVQVRNAMIIAAISFLVSYFLFKGTLGIQAVYIAYFAHLFSRTVYLSCVTKTIYRDLPAEER